MFFNKSHEKGQDLLEMQFMLRAIIQHLGIDFDFKKELLDALPENFADAIAKEDKKKAIKLYHKYTGIELAQAQAAIERHWP